MFFLIFKKESANFLSKKRSDKFLKTLKVNEFGNFSNLIFEPSNVRPTSVMKARACNNI